MPSRRDSDRSLEPIYLGSPTKLRVIPFEGGTTYSFRPRNLKEERQGIILSETDKHHIPADLQQHSLHGFANLDQEAITCFEPDQPNARVLYIKYDVHDDNCDHSETKNMKPIPTSTNCHSITRKQGTD